MHKRSESDYLKTAKKIISKHKLREYVNVLLDYWEENPTTLGHSFEHVLCAAVEIYTMAVKNKYPDPKEVFIGGLFHDIFRPVEGKDAQESHHEESAKIIRKLFKENGLHMPYAEKIINYLLSQEEARQQTEYNFSDYDAMIFLGERVTHTPLMTHGYVWASNKYIQEKTGKYIYTNHLESLFSFVKYQVVPWKVMMAYRKKYIGVEKALESYIDSYIVSATNHLKDKKGKGYFAYLEKMAEKLRKREYKFLKAFGRSDEQIAKIMQLMY